MSKQKPINNITPAPSDAILIDRNQARVLLGGVSYSTINRMEQSGRLTPIRLTNSAKAKVFFRRSEVLAQAGIQHEEVTSAEIISIAAKKHAPKIPNTIVVEGRTYIEVADRT